MKLEEVFYLVYPEARRNKIAEVIRDKIAAKLGFLFDRYFDPDLYKEIVTKALEDVEECSVCTKERAADIIWRQIGSFLGAFPRLNKDNFKEIVIESIEEVDKEIAEHQTPSGKGF